jgi:hypothetical protein
MAFSLEERFIVINHKHLNKVPDNKRLEFLRALSNVQEYLPNNKYIVINKDEEYSEKVIELLKTSEESKINEKTSSPPNS